MSLNYLAPAEKVETPGGYPYNNDNTVSDRFEIRDIRMDEDGTVVIRDQRNVTTTFNGVKAETLNVRGRIGIVSSTGVIQVYLQ